MKKKARVYCWVPGCYNPPVLDRHTGYGRCPEHRWTPQPSKDAAIVRLPTARRGKGICRICGHGSNTVYHKQECASSRLITDADRRHAAEVIEQAIFGGAS